MWPTLIPIPTISSPIRIQRAGVSLPLSSKMRWRAQACSRLPATALPGPRRNLPRPRNAANLFEIEKIADGVYFALARPSAMVNSNAAIFVNSSDVVVVDAHSKPSAAAALIAQLREEVTPKPVRYLIDTHFHFDHTQGNSAYLVTGNKVDIVATTTTKKLMEQLVGPRLRASLDPSSPGPRSSAQQVAHRLEDLRQRVGKATSATEQRLCNCRSRNWRPLRPR
jgi:hypothetical protein